MRFVTAVALAAVMLWVPVDGVAQGLGEKIRVRLHPDDSWTEGLLSELNLGPVYVEDGVAKDSSTFVMMDETGSSRQVLRVQEIPEGDYLEPRQLRKYSFAAGAALGIGLELILPCADRYPVYEHRCWSESAVFNRQKQFLYNAVGYGLIVFLGNELLPRRWADWIEDGRIVVN